MTLRRAAIVGIALALAAPVSNVAQAQDDLLAPLAPPSKKSTSKKKPAQKSPPPQENSDFGLLAPLAPAAPTQLFVKVSAGVTGAKLFVDGKLQSVLPSEPFAVPPGEHKIEVRRPGFADHAQTVNVKASSTEEVVVALKPTAGVLTVNADVPGAEVKVDGKAVGNAPVRELLLPPGEHSVVVSRDGFETESSKVRLEAGKDYTIGVALVPRAVASADRPTRDPNLTPNLTAAQQLPVNPPASVSTAPKSWYQNWYVWAGFGAVVAAGVAGAVVVTQKDAGAPPSTAATSAGLVRF